MFHATNFETCELLIMWKADVNAKDNNQVGPTTCMLRHKRDKFRTEDRFIELTH